MSEFSDQKPSGEADVAATAAVAAAKGRWVLIAWSVLSGIALLAHLPAALEGWKSPASRVQQSVGDLAGVVAQIRERVPLDEAILVDAWQAPRAPADQFVERKLAYWVFPRRVYSVAAIRKTSESVEEFVRRRGLRWGVRWSVRFRSLIPIDPSTIDRDFAGGSFPDPVIDRVGVARSKEVFGPLLRPDVTGWLLVVLAGAIALAGGRGALRLLGVDGEMSCRVEVLGWSWLVGLSVTALSGLLLFLSGRPVTGWLALLPSLLLALPGAVAVLGRRIPGDRVTDKPDTASMKVVPVLGIRSRLLVGAWVGLVVLIAASGGIDGFDQRMQWAYKARLMQVELGPWSESVFADPDHVHFHPRYPLLVPAAEAVWGGVGMGVEKFGVGGFSESAAVMIFPATWLALAGVVVGGLSRLGSVLSVRGGLLFLALPVYSGLGSFQNNLAAFNGCPELVVGALLLAAVVAGLAADKLGGGWWVLCGLCLVVAGLAKSEGPVAVAVVLGVALAGAVAHRNHRAIRRIGAVGLVVAAVLVIHEVVFTRGVVGGILPDDYRELLTVGAVWEGIGRLPAVGFRLLLEAAVAPWFGAIGVLLVVAVVQSRGDWRVPAVGWPLVVSLLMLVAYCVPFLVIPDYENNLDWAAGRLVVQIVPLSAWSLIVILLRSPPQPTAAHRSDRSVNSLAGDGS